MNMTPKTNRGLSLIEVVVALAISSILIAASYRVFTGQQKTYTIQEQVVDAQQNLRPVMSKMVREIRMAGFGIGSDILGLGGDVNGFTQVITPVLNSITVLEASPAVSSSGQPILVNSVGKDLVTGKDTLTLNYATSVVSRK